MKKTQEHFFNRRNQKVVRQWLRNNATPTERILWLHLRKRTMLGMKFRRQHGIGAYIVDFYCPELKLVIELDGDIHETKEARDYDRERDRFLRDHGIKTIRFSNNDVLENIEFTLLNISEQIIQLRS